MPDPRPALSATLVGAAWMVLSCVAFGMMSVFIRLSVTTLPGPEVAFFRNFGACLLLAPFFLRGGLSMLRAPRPWAVGSLVLWQAISNLTWVLAIAVVPLANASAIMFMTPILAVVMAAALGIERVGLGRWIATLVGFGGMLIIVRPGLQDTPPEAFLVLVTAIVTAFFSLTVRNLGRDHHPDTLVLYALVGSLPVLGAVAAWTWRMPNPGEAAYLAGVGLCAAIGQVAMTRGYAAAESSLMVPLMFLQLPATALAAYIAFGELPDAFTWIGAGVIFASSLAIVRRGSRS
jgi:drug/metabolite transporter (DMT)-like permease